MCRYRHAHKQLNISQIFVKFHCTLPFLVRYCTRFAHGKYIPYTEQKILMKIILKTFKSQSFEDYRSEKLVPLKYPAHNHFFKIISSKWIMKKNFKLFHTWKFPVTTYSKYIRTYAHARTHAHAHAHTHTHTHNNGTHFLSWISLRCFAKISPEISRIQSFHSGHHYPTSTTCRQMFNF